jgi:hypothetical protein
VRDRNPLVTPGLKTAFRDETEPNEISAYAVPFCCSRTSERTDNSPYRQLPKRGFRETFRLADNTFLIRISISKRLRWQIQFWETEYMGIMRLEHVSKDYVTEGSPVAALHDVNLEVRPGEENRRS